MLQSNLHQREAAEAPPFVDTRRPGDCGGSVGAQWLPVLFPGTFSAERSPATKLVGTG